MSKKKSIEDFVSEARVVHRDKYDYSDVEYVNSTSKVAIICPIHGVFLQSPVKHLRGQGCPECGKLARAKSISSNTDKFITKAIEVHNGKYSYNKVEYVNNSTPVVITCKLHGDFSQRPDKHLIGHGCPVCAGNIMISKEEFVSRSRKIHGDKYDYTKSICCGTHNKTIITCPIHGDFEQTPKEHMAGKGCPECGNISKHNKLKLDDDVAIERIKDACKGRYVVPDDLKYVNKNTKVRLICKTHGDFYVTPSNLWNMVGCPKCSNQFSKAEDEIYEYVCKLIDRNAIVRRDKSLLGNLVSYSYS